MALIIIFITLMFSPALLATPFVPNTEGQILERLPLAANRDLRALRQSFNANPQQLDSATKLAKRYIALGKAEADPRYYGYAQGVLGPWWDMPEPAADILLLRALIRQNRHDFGNALSDLSLLLRREPGNAEAWLTQAIILQVQARYDEAQRSCLPLVTLDAPIVASTCLASINSLTGHAASSYAFLQDALKEAKNSSPDQHLWTLTVLAEIAVRMAKTKDAGQFFSQAINVRRQDIYLLGAYSDFLLDQQRPAEALALLADKARIDGLLLRVALAKQQLGDKGLNGLITELTARFTASRLRGENLHQGDEARFALYLLKQPQLALQLATTNWLSQREPKDARILLEAAIAANQPEAAAAVVKLLKATGMEAARLQELAAQLEKIKLSGQQR